MAETPTRGESGNGGESPVLAVIRAGLADRLEAAGHGGCAHDLEAADEGDVVRVAYEIAEHVEYACGNPPYTDPRLAQDIRTWADLLEDPL